MLDDRVGSPVRGGGDSAPGSVVVLVDAATRTERELIGGWLADGGATTELGATVTVTQIDMDSGSIAARLVGRSDDPLVLPVRVLWLPPERDGVRRTTFADLALLSNPRRPHRLLQRRLVAAAPDRHVILAGRPARLGALRATHAEVAGSPESLARAIVRAGTVALERAEREVIGDRYKIPRLVAEEILDSPEFLRRLDAIALEIGADPNQVYRRADKGLRELVAAQSRLVSDLFTQVMRPVHASAWKVDADESGLSALRRLNREYPLVFLPSHRSYVDPFVLGDALARNDFPPNHVIGGANLGFWPMGPIARRTGTVFIRRSFGDDEVYKAVVEEYFAYLLAKRFNLEWYFEGGRTRTGKLRPPRFGLLNYLAAALRSGRIDDALLVPVSITYERLNELGAIATEQSGGGKKPEGLPWLARYIRSQQHSAGTVYVRFGEPLSARDRLIAHGDPMRALPWPHSRAEDEVLASERKAVQQLAFEVAVGINEVTPVTVNALVTLALLGVHERALTLGEVRSVLEPVRGYLRRRALPTGELDTLDDDQGLAVVLEQLSLAKVVTVYRGGLEPVYSIESGAHLEAAFYRNSAVHWFVNRAILELAVLEVAEAPPPDSGDIVDEIREAAFRLRDLLKFEFFFPDRLEFAAALRAEVVLTEPDWERFDSCADMVDALSATGFIMAHRVLRSFFDAQLVVSERLAAADPTQPLDRRQFIDDCLAVGRQMLLQRRLHSAESVSSELFSSALKLADNYGLVEPGAPDLADRRRELANELAAIGTRISRAATLDPSHRAPGDPS